MSMAAGLSRGFASVWVSALRGPPFVTPTPNPPSTRPGEGERNPPALTELCAPAVRAHCGHRRKPTLAPGRHTGQDFLLPAKSPPRATPLLHLLSRTLPKPRPFRPVLLHLFSLLLSGLGAQSGQPAPCPSGSGTQLEHAPAPEVSRPF